MGDVQLSSAVSAVVSAFHSAVENVQNIRKKSNRFIRSEKTVKEKLLQETLETAEYQISERYSQHFREVGEQFAVGDDVARDRLFRIAILMQSGLVRGLQIAMQVEDANLDLTKLQEDALMTKRDCLDALDSLRDRLLRQYGATSPTPSQMHPLLRRPSSESIGTHISSHTMSSNNSGTPGGVMLGDDPNGRPDMARPEMGRLLSARRALNRHSSTLDPARITDLTSMDWPGAAPIHPALRQFSPDPSPRADESAYPGSGKKSPDMGREGAISTLSDWSDKIVVVNTPSTPPAQSHSPQNHSPFPPAPTSFPSAPPTWTQAQPPPVPARAPSRPAPGPPGPPGPPSPGTNSNRSASSSFSFAQSLSTGPASPGLAPGVNIIPDNSSAIQHHHHSRLPSFRLHKHSGSGTLTPGAGTLLGPGRPDKHNNYWGFCKSAWTIREDPKKGLSTFDKPDGFHIFRKVWLCKTCAFDGEVFGQKKPYIFDPNVHVAKNGLRYKWIFLAKSHAKKKAMEDACYGCILCVADGKATGIFGDVDTLMGHILSDHGRGVRDEVRDRCRAVFGRVAGATEEWDINLPPYVMDRVGI